MQFDPENKVVKLCGEGMMLEGEGRKTEAHALFEKAWDLAENDFEAFTAAHYVARNQQDPQERLKWNLLSLERANKVEHADMNYCYPSLYLNIGKSYEDLGYLPQAIHHYQLGQQYCSFLPPGGYSDMIKGGIANGLKRTSV
jgi:tetratricopeptide (TPR) repeat protein